MRWMLGAALFIFFAGGIALTAQQQPASPAAQKADPVRKYDSPSAAKSVEIGDFYLHRKKFQAALSRFQEALATDPHYAPAYRELGRVYEKMELLQKALDAYRRYLDELPSAQEAKEAKEIHKAIARLQRHVSEKPAKS